VDAFWSVIVYDATGHLQKNQYNAYSLNSITANKGADGSVAIQLGGCDGKIPNCLPTMPGLELHGAPLPPAPRNPERHLDLPRSRARDLSSRPTWTPPT
jgi:Protein of unknown function (DUF1214)